MVWLIAGIPAVTLLAAVALIVIMVRSDKDDAAGPPHETSAPEGRELASGMPPP